MTLYFIPVEGKNPVTGFKWGASRLTEKQAWDVKGATGVAIYLGPSNMTAIDIDDLKRCREKFNNIGIDIDKFIAENHQAISPKLNSAKVFCTLPKGVALRYVKLTEYNAEAAKEYATLELRCGEHYDVYVGSAYNPVISEGQTLAEFKANYSDNRIVKAGGSPDIKELPPEFLEFWLEMMEAQEYDDEYTTNENPLGCWESPGKLSVIYAHKRLIDLRETLEELGFKKKPGFKEAWQTPDSESKGFGMNLIDSNKNPGMIGYCHHASGGWLHKRSCDSFDVRARYYAIGKDRDKAKAMYAAMIAKKLPAINYDTGEDYGMSVHDFNKPATALRSQFESVAKGVIPKFPVDAILSWPEPWPMLWKEWCKLPRFLVPELLFPAFLAVHAYLLGHSYRTIYGRRLGLYFLTLAPSTAHKDGNSRDAIISLSDAITKIHGVPSMFFLNLLSYPRSVSADTSLIESFTFIGESKQKGNLFWLNTEGTGLFKKISSSGNDNVSAISDVVVDIVDGKGIQPKKKAGKEAIGVSNPNAQMVFYTQPETVRKYLNQEITDSGFLGRALICIHDRKDKRAPILMRYSEHKISSVSAELADFYKPIADFGQNVSFINLEDYGQFELMSGFMQDKIEPLIDSYDSKSGTADAAEKLLTRLGISTEQLFAVMVGICDRWDHIHNRPKRKHIDASGICPLIEYWAHTKMYTIENYIQESGDILGDELLKVIKELISGKLKLKKAADTRILRDQAIVPIQAVIRVIKNRPVLLEKLKLNNDNKNITSRVDSLLTLMEKHGGIVTKTIGITTYIGIPE